MDKNGGNMDKTRSWDGQLRDKVAIVTGGASGMGEAICVEFAAEGAAIAIADLNLRGAETVIEQIRQLGGRGIALETDIADYQRVEQFVDRTLREFGTVDVLVNCAGINFFLSPDAITLEQWRQIMSTNLDGTWHFSKAVMPEMMRKRSGKIINIGSGGGILAIPKAAHYSASKAAVIGLTRALAVDLGGYNVNVNCICPGTVLTPLADKTLSPFFRAEQTKRTPLGRLGRPSDIAKAALFLASSASDWITGTVLPVDGGLTCCIRAHHWE